MGGNIGLPILAQDPLPEGGVYVLELSSYQIDLTQSLDCDVAVLLNITPDHLDRYESFEAYAASKARLFEMQSTRALAVIDDDRWHDSCSDRLGDVRDATVAWSDARVRCFDRISRAGRRFKVRTMRRMPPRRSRSCSALGVGRGRRSRKASAPTPACRTAWSASARRTASLFVNDSKATNPTATAPALAAFERIRWICGGQAKTDNLDECAPHFGHVARGLYDRRGGRIVRAAA